MGNFVGGFVGPSVKQQVVSHSLWKDEHCPASLRDVHWTSVKMVGTFSESSHTVPKRMCDEPHVRNYI